MKRSDGRILTTHAGSLPRSPKLVDLHVALSKGEVAHGVVWEKLRSLRTGADIASRMLFRLTARHARRVEGVFLPPAGIVEDVLIGPE